MKSTRSGPADAVANLEMNVELDVHPVLPSIQIPTLVMNASGDRVVPIEFGRAIVRDIPGARFVEFPGDDHLPFVVSPDERYNSIASGTLFRAWLPSVANAIPEPDTSRRNTRRGRPGPGSLGSYDHDVPLRCVGNRQPARLSPCTLLSSVK